MRHDAKEKKEDAPRVGLESTLLWQAHTPQQIGVLRVGTQRSPFCVHCEPREITRAFFASLFEPSEGVLLVAKPEINGREVDGRHILVLRKGPKLG
jgi:hypothetical protein